MTAAEPLIRREPPVGRRRRSSTSHEIRGRHGVTMQRESGPDTLGVTCDRNSRRSSSMPRSILGAPSRGSTLGIINIIRMRTNIRQFRCERVSASEAGDGFQVLFERAPDSDAGYVLVQRHFEFPDREECYVESDDREFSGHFRIQRASLSRNGFWMAFGRNPVRKIAVTFDATDSVYTEVKRVLQIMIPKIIIS